MYYFNICWNTFSCQKQKEHKIAWLLVLTVTISRSLENIHHNITVSFGKFQMIHVKNELLLILILIAMFFSHLYTILKEKKRNRKNFQIPSQLTKKRTLQKNSYAKLFLLLDTYSTIVIFLLQKRRKMLILPLAQHS